METPSQSKAKQANQRKFKRLRMDRSVRIPVHLFPHVPFIGHPVSATLINLSAGGMAIIYSGDTSETKTKRGMELKIHFRLPGKPLQECHGVVAHIFTTPRGEEVIGIRFCQCPTPLAHEFELMAADNDACDRRLEQSDHAWCLPTCAFFELCRKPIRPTSEKGLMSDRMEIVLQTRDKGLDSK